MNKYKVTRNISGFENLININKLKGGAAKGPPPPAPSFSGWGDLDLTSLMRQGSGDKTLYSWSQGSNVSETESNVSDTGSNVSDTESDISVSSLISHVPILRTVSQELPSNPKALPIQRALSSGATPIAHNTILIKHRGDTQEEINHDVSITLTQILGKEINAQVIPVVADGSCGISSIIALIKGRVPSTMEAYDERRKIGIDTFPPSAAFLTKCHGDNLDASFLINYVSEELETNLIIIHENMLLLPSKWLGGEPAIFLIGDGEHYNAVEINSYKVIQPSNPIYNILLKAPKVDLGGVHGIFPK